MCPEFKQDCQSQRNQAQTVIWLDALICLRTEQINETGAFYCAVIRMQSGPAGLPPGKLAKIAARYTRTFWLRMISSRVASAESAARREVRGFEGEGTFSRTIRKRPKSPTA